jgi:hypothetical protein
MIKATAGDMVLFGLSEKNVQLLKEGKPIKIDMTELGLTGKVLIFYGKTEEDMMSEFKKHGLLPAAIADGSKQ